MAAPEVSTWKPLRNARWMCSGRAAITPRRSRIPVECDQCGEGVARPQYGNFSGHVDRWHYYDYQAPCIAVIDFGSAEAGVIVDPEHRSAGLRIFACHFIAPVDNNVCIDHWLHVRNFVLGHADVDQRLRAAFRVAFDEDKCRS